MDKQNTQEEVILIEEEASEQILVPEDTEKITTHPEKIKKRKVKFSVKLKFAILIAILITLITLFITIYLLNKQKKDLLAEMKYRAQIISQNLSRSISEIMDDDTTRHQILMETKEVRDIEEIALIDLNNNLIDHTDSDLWKKIIFSKFDESIEKVSANISEGILNRLRKSKTKYIEKEYQENGEEKFYIISPVKFEDTVLGFLKIVFTKKDIILKIKSIQRSITIFTIIAIIVGIIGAYTLATIIIKPIKKLSEGAVIIGTGNLDYKIEIKSHDELGQLADEFNNMTGRLKEAQRSLIEKERYEEQLEIARGIQENLLPDRFPSLKEIDISAYYKAAKGVGGDYYDVVHIKEKNRISGIIADVSGKGVPAALVMVMIRTIFHSTARFVNTPNEAISEINSGVVGRLSADKFATIFAFHYNYKTGVIEFSNAAHSPMLVFKSKTGEILELDTEGVPVGIDENAIFGLKKLQLETDDIIVMHTDGITEAMNEKSEMFKSERLKNIIKGNSTLDANNLKNLIIDEVNRFVGNAEQHDDMTLLVLKVNISPPQNISIPSSEKIRREVLNPLDPFSLLL